MDLARGKQKILKYCLNIYKLYEIFKNISKDYLYAFISVNCYNILSCYTLR